MTYIKDYKIDSRIKEVLLVTNLLTGTSNNGKAYLTIGFQDKTGRIDGKLWDVKEEDITTFAVGNIVEVTAEVINYREALQLKIIEGTRIDPTKYDISELTISSPVPLLTLEEQLRDIIGSINDKDVKAIVTTIINTHYQKFILYPAATRNHHEYVSGLLEHTLSIATVASYLAGFYENIDRDLLVGAALLHDIGKTRELSGPIATQYTTEGKLIGHISLVASEIQAVSKELNITSEVPTLLTHIVLAHHGKLEFGSPVLPATKEALLLSMIDDMDAKMKMLDKALDPIKDGEFTPRLWAINETSFYKAKKR